jgi:hypothetical protein
MCVNSREGSFRVGAEYLEPVFLKLVSINKYLYVLFHKWVEKLCSNPEFIFSSVVWEERATERY